jgi:threonine/homoserine/homoserine lactone efflux protein
MVPAARIAEFAILSWALIIVPGPNVLFVISRSLQQGRAAGLAAVAGGQLGECVQVSAVAFGIGALVEAS